MAYLCGFLLYSSEAGKLSGSTAGGPRSELQQGQILKNPFPLMVSPDFTSYPKTENHRATLCIPHAVSSLIFAPLQSEIHLSKALPLTNLHVQFLVKHPIVAGCDMPKITSDICSRAPRIPESSVLARKLIILQPFITSGSFTSRELHMKTDLQGQSQSQVKQRFVPPTSEKAFWLRRGKIPRFILVS